MPHQVLQSSTDGFYIFADNADAYGEGLTGLTISCSLSKSGGPFLAVAPTITDLGGGLYWISPLAAHRDTLGEIAWRFSADGAVIAPRFERVVAVDDQTPAWGAGQAVLDAAAVSPVHSNVVQVNSQPADIATGAGLQEVLGAIEDSSFGAVVVPLLGQIQARTEGTTIRLFTSESATITMAIVNAAGEPVETESLTLSLIIERQSGADLAVVDDSGITKAGSSISFAVPSSVCQREGSHVWALRSDGGQVLMRGPLIVEYAPEVGS